MQPIAYPDQVAAVDLGSNSFHLVVARVSDGQVQLLDRLKEMVRLGAGLDENKRLTPEAQRLALACLDRFGQRLRSLAVGTVRVVGTNTLRSARNAEEFIALAEQALGHPIDIISGIEEARLIYQGVAHTLADDGHRRLVIDIGGGSTELAVGQGYDTLDVESLYMGCVSMSRRFFPDGAITAKAMRKAEIAAQLELRPVVQRLRAQRWSQAIGASGTILTVADVIRAEGWGQQGISRAGLNRLVEAMVAAGHVDKLGFSELNERRRPVFPGGVAVLRAAFDALNIEQLSVSQGALREGLVYDLLGRIRHEDVRQHSVDTLARRGHVELAQARRVRRTALALLAQVSEGWRLGGEEWANALGWAAQLHEIGLSIAHGQYHKHGAYLLEHCDLPGFARHEQRLLAALVRGHRRKFPTQVFQALPAALRQPARRLCVLLRVAVLLHRERSRRALPEIKARTTRRALVLGITGDWLEAHPMTRADLEAELALLKDADPRLKLD